MPAELPAVRLSSFAKSSGATTRKMKPPGSERKIYGKTTPTCFLANPNLEGEIHLKGARFVTSQIFNLKCYILDHHCIAYFIAFCQILENPKQLKDPRRELGIFPGFHIWFLSNNKTRIFGFNYFSLRKIFHIKINERRKYDFSTIIEILEEKY